MNPFLAYRQRRADGWTRIDRVLSLLDGLLDGAERALHLLGQGDGAAARSALVSARAFLDGLAGEVASDGTAAAAELLRLREFLGHRLGAGRAEAVEAVLPVLRDLRQGFLAVRRQADRLGRQGIPTALGGDACLPVTA